MFFGDSVVRVPPSSAPGTAASAAVGPVDDGETFDVFVKRAAAQRALWTDLSKTADVSPGLLDRFRRASDGLQLLVVAEDWCVDSANTLPFLARLADDAGVPLRVIGRVAGRRFMEAHRTADGRVATPLVVLFRRGHDAGAWVERPAPLQQMFRMVGRSPDAARAFADRQAWYAHDRGRTALAEIVQLAERSATTDSTPGEVGR